MCLMQKVRLTYFSMKLYGLVVFLALCVEKYVFLQVTF